MRTSNQLQETSACQRNVLANIQGVSRMGQLASAQKQVVNALMRGEEIPSIFREIDSILKEKNFKWETLEQRIGNEKNYEKRIEKFMEVEIKQNREHIVLPDDFDTTVDYFGEEVLALPDYFKVYRDRVEVCKISTAAYVNEEIDVNKAEMYALGLCGEKLFPRRNVYVTMVHLNPGAAAEITAYNKTPSGDYAFPMMKHSTIEMNERTKQVFEELHEQEGKNTCSSEMCVSCPQKNICNYQQAPVLSNIEVAVRSLNEIRLSSEQRRAVDFELGNARCNAGPGGGKTLVVAVRIATLLEKGYNPEDIVLLTYTNAGAQEMTARTMAYAASKGIALDPENFKSGTINSFCQKIIDEHYDELGYIEPPRIVPEEKRKKIINKILDIYPRISSWKYTQISDLETAQRSHFPSGALFECGRIFSLIKGQSLTIDNARSEYYSEFAGLSSKELMQVFEMYQKYDEEMKKINCIEFEDHINEVNRLLTIHPTLFEEMGIKHILVDEFQDTDLPQIELLQKMKDTTNFKSFMVVGDDSQSIFGFRHTSPEFMINFGDYFGRFEDFNLVENHRSQANIVEFANEINGKATLKVDKDLIATKIATKQPIIQGYYSKKQEMLAIAEDIKKRWDAGERDIAVMMSQRNELREMAGALAEFGVPSVLMCRIPYVENSRVAALQTFYDSFTGKSTQGFADYQNVITGGSLSGATNEQMNEAVERMRELMQDKEKTLSTFMEFARALDEDETDPCYQSFLEKLEFCRNSQELSDFWEEFRLYGNESEYKREGMYEGVCLNTIHSSKGLEWDTTYLSVSKLDSIKRHKKHTVSEEDEIIRKFFVGATRARENLIITGNYVLGNDSNSMIFNDFLKMAYDIANKPFDYNYEKYNAIRREEQKAADEARKKKVQPTVRKQQSADVRAALQRYQEKLSNSNEEKI